MKLMDILKNKSKDLRVYVKNIFKRKETEKHSYSYNYSTPSYSSKSAAYNAALANGTFRVYFYEWSDINREPLVFSTFVEFSNFLKKCDIPILYWEENLILSLTQSYITCKKNTKQLVIRNRYNQLESAMK